MKTLKVVLLSCCVVASMGVTQSVHAFSLGSLIPSTDTIVNKMLDTVSSAGAGMLCTSGGITKPSFRSYDGIAGKLKPLAAAGMLLCEASNAEGYKDSKFRKNAVATLGTENMADIRTMFLADVKKASGPVKKLVCKLATGGSLDKGGVPVSTLAAGVCGAPA